MVSVLYGFIRITCACDVCLCVRRNRMYRINTIQTTAIQHNEHTQPIDGCLFFVLFFLLRKDAVSMYPLSNFYNTADEVTTKLDFAQLTRLQIAYNDAISEYLSCISCAVFV